MLQAHRLLNQDDPEFIQTELISPYPPIKREDIVLDRLPLPAAVKRKSDHEESLRGNVPESSAKRHRPMIHAGRDTFANLSPAEQFLAKETIYRQVLSAPGSVFQRPVTVKWCSSPLSMTNDAMEIFENALIPSHMLRYAVDAIVSDQGSRHDCNSFVQSPGDLDTAGRPPLSDSYFEKMQELNALKKQLFQMQKNRGIPSKEVWSTCRSMANPFEKLSLKPQIVAGQTKLLKSGSGDQIKQFLNRAAVKLAMLDAMIGLSQTEIHGNPLLFADVCGGPGGFTGGSWIE